MGEFEVLKHLDVCVPDQEVPVLLSPALLKGPVLTTLDTPALHHPETHRIPLSLLLLGLPLLYTNTLFTSLTHN